MSQRQLAAMLAGDGASTNSVENLRRQISSWVNDHHVPEPENAEALARALDVPVEWLTAAPSRRNLAAALEDLGQAIALLTTHVETEQARSEEAAQIVRDLDRRLADIEAVQGRLLEGQLTAAAVLGEMLGRLDAGQGSRPTPRSEGKKA